MVPASWSRLTTGPGCFPLPWVPRTSSPLASVGGGSGEELSAEMMDAFDLDESEVVIRVSLPGEPTEHNADRVEGGTLIWEPVLADGGPFEFSARSSPAGDDASGGSGGYALLAVVLLLAFAAGAVFISLRDRRRRSESGTDLTGGQE